MKKDKIYFKGVFFIWLYSVKDINHTDISSLPKWAAGKFVYGIYRFSFHLLEYIYIF